MPLEPGGGGGEPLPVRGEEKPVPGRVEAPLGADPEAPPAEPRDVLETKSERSDLSSVCSSVSEVAVDEDDVSNIFVWSKKRNEKPEPQMSELRKLTIYCTTALTFGMSLFMPSTSLEILSISSFRCFSPSLSCCSASSTAFNSLSIELFCSSSPSLTARVSVSSCDRVAATSSYFAVSASRSDSRIVWLGGCK